MWVGLSGGAAALSEPQMAEASHSILYHDVLQYTILCNNTLMYYTPLYHKNTYQMVEASHKSRVRLKGCGGPGAFQSSETIIIML